MKALVLTIAFVFVAASSIAEPKFVGAVVAEWVRDKQEMKLIEEFGFIDSNEHTWIAPAGAIIDGASIPRVFWNIIGGPFSGLYREASVIHDYHVDARVGYWKDVHRIFYEGMLASGVPRTKAKLMYAAVYYFGPRWKTIRSPSLKCIEENLSCFGYIEVAYELPTYDADAFDRLTDFVMDTDPTDDELQSFDDEFFQNIRERDSMSFSEEYYFAPPIDDTEDRLDRILIDRL